MPHAFLALQHKRLTGKGALPALLAQIRDRESEMVALARGLFAAWLEHVVGLPVPTASRDV